MGFLDDLLGQAGKFVEQKKGIWDHEAWNDFLSEVSKKGVQITDDMQSYLGSILESMKLYYSAVSHTQGISESLMNIASKSSEFIMKTGGQWDHHKWEEYLNDLRNNNFVVLNDETKQYIGGILESARNIYSKTPADILNKKTPIKTPKTKEITMPINKAAEVAPAKKSSGASTRTPSPSRSKKS